MAHRFAFLLDVAACALASAANWSTDHSSGWLAEALRPLLRELGGVFALDSTVEGERGEVCGNALIGVV
jgi:hypothetical protein